MTTTQAKARALELANGYQSTCLIVAAHKIGLLNALLQGPLSTEDLALRLDLAPGPLSRFTRALESIGLLQIGLHGAAVLSECGKILASQDSNISGLVTLISEQYLPAWTNLGRTLVDGKPAFEHVFGVSVWEHRQAHSNLNDAFGRLIKEPPSNEIIAILGAYDFTRSRKIVDVGGGRGWLLARILEINEEASGVLFDQPHVVHSFFDTIENASLKKRCATVGGSFFDSIPDQGDLYLVQSILHDWSDEDCIRILKTLRKSMKNGTRALVLERIIPAGGSVPIPMTMLDMHMMAVLGGNERTLAEFDALFQQAELRRLRVVTTAGSAADIIEIEAATSTAPSP